MGLRFFGFIPAMVIPLFLTMVSPPQMFINVQNYNYYHIHNHAHL